MITKLNQILTKAQEIGPSRLIVAAAADLHTLEAVSAAAECGIVSVTLVGDKSRIFEIASGKGIDLSHFIIIDIPNDQEAVLAATKAVREGRADILMKGLISTDVYMRGILNKEAGIAIPRKPISHIAVMEFPMIDRLLLISDVAIIPNPDLNQKVAIAGYLTSLAHALDIETPRIAVIAPSEQVLPYLTSSSEAAIVAKMCDRGQIKNAIIDGPLALDVAIDHETAKVKGLTSPVEGRADCLLFPNIESSNVFFKCSTKLCKAELAGVVVGAKAPCVLTSRGDTVQSKLYSISLAVLLACRKR